MRKEGAVTKADVTEIEGKPKSRKVARFTENPFMTALEVRTRGKRLTVARGSPIVDLGSGEIEAMTEIAQVIDVDEGQFVKLYTKDLAVWFDLGRAALRVFGAVLSRVQESAIGRDLIYIEHDSKEVGAFDVSKATFYRGLEELITKGFMARHKSLGWYYINPAMFFNGDRARLVKEYRVTKTGSKLVLPSRDTKTISDKSGSTK